MASARASILLFTEDPTVAQTVGRVLEMNPEFTLADHCTDLAQLKQKLEDPPYEAVLLDCDPAASALIKEIEPYAARLSHTRFIMLAARVDQGLIVEAMQIGARYVMQKAAMVRELLPVLQRLIPTDFRSQPLSGEVITVLSASGGCGATTVAVNLANELRLAASRPVLLADLDNYYGAIPAYLGLQNRFGLADVLNHKGLIDPQLIVSSATTYEENFQVMLNPISIENSPAAELPLQRLGDFLKACRQAYRYTVVDAPRLPAGAMIQLARESLKTVIVFQLTVKDVHAVQKIVSTLTGEQIAPYAILPLANRYSRKGRLLSLQDARQALNLAELPFLRNDFKGALHSLNFGQPLAKSAPRSPLRKDIYRIASTLSLNGAAKK